MELNREKLIVDHNAVCRQCDGNGYLKDLNYSTQTVEYTNCFFCDSSGKETVLVYKKDDANA
tara:strand:+ start:647 stop:832 length:186 start_codon:yes stop_codon:yes gene_type:complete